MMACFSFRIRKKYFDAIVKGEKTVEYRRDSPFWQLRIAHLLINLDMQAIWEKLLKGELFETGDLTDEGVSGVCICGKRVHRRVITKIARILTPEDFSDQGKKDVDTKTCFGFYLGDEFFSVSSGDEVS